MIRGAPCSASQPATHTAEGSSASGHHGVACGQLGKVLCGPSGCHWLPEDLQPADDLSESRGLRQASLTRTEGRQDAAPSSCRRRRRRPERGHPTSCSARSGSSHLSDRATDLSRRHRGPAAPADGERDSSELSSATREVLGASCRQAWRDWKSVNAATAEGGPRTPRPEKATDGLPA